MVDLLYPGVPMHPSRLTALSALGALVLLSACTWSGEQSIRPERSTDGSLVITAEQIARSNARDAWEVIRFAGVPVSLHDAGSRGISRIQRRGQSSILLNDGAIVVVDGARMTDPDGLKNVRAERIHTMEIMNSSRATQVFGTGAVGGAVVVWTLTGPESDSSEG